jgi:hypothetical protein
MDPESAKLFFHPRLRITGESVAQSLDISLDQANQVLSRPGTHTIILNALEQAFQETIRKTLIEMVRIPHETVPTRVDCSVRLTGVFGEAVSEL